MNLDLIKRSLLNVQLNNPKKNLAIFSVCTNNFYIVYAITSLLSYRKHYPEADLFLFGRFSQENIKLIQSCSVIPYKINLKSEFRMKPGSKYPSECFWWLAVPEKLHSRYKFSMYVDGDTISISRIPSDVIYNVQSISGDGTNDIRVMIDYADKVRRKGNDSDNKIVDILDLDLQKIMNYRMINRKGVMRVNSSIMLFNNSWAKEFHLLEKSTRLFFKILNSGEYWNGDDSFLSLLAFEYPDMPLGFINNMHNNGIGDFYHIYHFNKTKPWTNSDDTHIREWQSNIHSNTRKYFGTLDRMYWYNGFVNFGDVIGPWLFQKIRGKYPIFADATPTQKSFYTVGSIVSKIKSNGVVWGSGISGLNIKPHSSDNLIIKSVRGPLTRHKLSSLSIHCPESYGDAGLLLPLYYNPKVEKRYELGIIPHHVDYDSIKQDDNVLVINLNTSNIEQVIEQILSCKKTISSSLHGLVVSAAYKIPTYWVKFSDKVHGDDTKFWDFYLSLLPKESHKNLIGRAITKIEKKTFPDDVLDRFAFKKLDPNNLDYNSLIDLPKFLEVKDSLIQEILSTCPFNDII